MYNKRHKHHSQVSSTCDVSRKPWVHYCSTDWLVSDFTLLSSVPPGEWTDSIHISNQATITSFYILSKLFLTKQPTIQLYMAQGTDCFLHDNCVRKRVKKKKIFLHVMLLPLLLPWGHYSLIWTFASLTDFSQPGPFFGFCLQFLILHLQCQEKGQQM